ncbi:MAG: nitroreductase family protein [Oscillospiraceae bacterium]|nr:nitroreductase family protein [Oscillospiraceae bacterium]
MDLYEAINRRRTVREFEAEPISADVLERIIRAAFKAPTNDHMRDWHYIIVRDKNVTAKLLDIIPKGISHEDMEALIKDWDLSDSIQQECYRNAVPKQYRMLFDASAVIIPLLKQKTDILHPDNVSHLNGFASIWCSIENIFLAATAEGYGCNLRIPLGDEAEHARTVLGFPNDYFMPCFIGIGVPKSDIVPVTQKEIDIKERIHWDRF